MYSQLHCLLKHTFKRISYFHWLGSQFVLKLLWRVGGLAKLMKGILDAFLHCRWEI